MTGNPEVFTHWLPSGVPPVVTVVNAAVIPCALGALPRRLATDVTLVEDAIIGPIPQGNWCDLRLVVEGATGTRQTLVIDIEDLSDPDAWILLIDGVSVGSLSAEVEDLGD